MGKFLVSEPNKSESVEPGVVEYNTYTDKFTVTDDLIRLNNVGYINRDARSVLSFDQLYLFFRMSANTHDNRGTLSKHMGRRVNKECKRRRTVKVSLLILIFFCNKHKLTHTKNRWRTKTLSTHTTGCTTTHARSARN